MLGIAVVAYINNRSVLLKKSLVSLLATFSLALVFSFSGPKVNLNPIADNVMEKMTDNNNQVESPSLMTHLFTFMLDIAKDKLSD
jgi:hypothetical protein